MNRKLLLLAVAVSLLAYGAKEANAAPPAEGWGAASLKVAQEYWGGAPPLCTSTAIVWEQPPMWDLGHPAAATAPTEPEPCVMWVSPTIPPFTMCVVMVHEYGHWMGLQWGTDPNNIMYDGDANNDTWNMPMIHGCVKLWRKH